MIVFTQGFITGFTVAVLMGLATLWLADDDVPDDLGGR